VTVGRPLKVGLYIPNGDGYMSGTINRWSDVLAMATAAEDAGFDSVWVADHMIFRFSENEEPQSRWECWSLLAGLATVTKRMEVGPLVNCMSFRNPGLLAKIAETVDEMSDGRLILAIGAGWHEPEYTGFGFPFDHRYSRFEESFTMLYDLLRTGKSNFQGTYYQANEGELRPRGPRPNRIPLMIGTQGERMLRLTAKYADAWNTTWIASVEELGPLIAAVDAACAEVGRDPASLERSACVYLDMPERIGRFPRNSTGGTGWSSNPEFVPPPARTPAENAEALRDYARAGLSHVMLWLDPSTPAGVTAFGEVLHLLDSA
jgi:alkanesulfonate monooxygenase SsuD/methylene tetrahydromethanopterin reductase-like flavin-dependent oxidoreductase (luciferase family)